MTRKYQIDFAELPPLGTAVAYRYKGEVISLKLIASQPYLSRDGRETHILEWLTSDGRKAISGLRSSSVGWLSLAEANQRRNRWQRENAEQRVRIETDGTGEGVSHG